ncbi:MAG: hypothetical protein ABWX90_00725 [Candidatus Saccharimonadales bacterium]
MNHKEKPSRKGKVYASIIGLVLAANILLSAVTVLINYPTEAHRATARQLDVLSVNMLNGEDFAKIMNSNEYKKAAESPEANYTNMATAYTLLFNVAASIALIGVVYYYLRNHRLSNKVVGATVLLVSIGQLLPLVFTQFGSAFYIGTQMPGIGSIAFMLFIGIIIAPLIIAIITRIFDWHYNRKHSFVID